LDLLILILFGTSSFDQAVELGVIVERALGARCGAMEEGVEGEIVILEDHIPGEDCGLEVAIAPAICPDARIEDVYIEIDANLRKVVLARDCHCLLGRPNATVEREVGDTCFFQQ
jgi:hypothetical protein